VPKALVALQSEVDDSNGLVDGTPGRGALLGAFWPPSASGIRLDHPGDRPLTAEPVGDRQGVRPLRQFVIQHSAAVREMLNHGCRP